MLRCIRCFYIIKINADGLFNNKYAWIFFFYSLIMRTFAGLLKIGIFV
jgi:hypothetical protein